MKKIILSGILLLLLLVSFMVLARTVECSATKPCPSGAFCSGVTNTCTGESLPDSTFQYSDQPQPVTNDYTGVGIVVGIALIIAALIMAYTLKTRRKNKYRSLRK